MLFHLSDGLAEITLNISVRFGRAAVARRCLLDGMAL